jgi:hypothetical protein
MPPSAASPPQPKSVTKPTADDFSARAIQRGVLADTLQHPATILPAAVAALSVLYMGVISFDPQSFGLAFGAALFGTAAWVVNYFLRGPSFAAARVAALQARRARYKEDQQEALKGRCAAERFTEGERVAAGLSQAYDKLQRFLRERAASGDLTAMRFSVLAEDTYQQGLDILQSALAAHCALRAVDRRALQHALEASKAERRALSSAKSGSDADTTARLATLETRIESQRKPLALYDARARTVQEQLAESEGLKAALETAYLEVIDLGREAAPDTHGQAANKLAAAVTAARHVDERLRAARDTSEEDKVYLQRNSRS